MDIKEKLITTAAPLIVAAILKVITHIFNMTGEKDKITREKIDLLKSTLAIDNSLHIAQYRILYEETFSLIFKKNLYFYEIKNLIHLKSPKKAIKVYLDARPYVKPEKSGDGFQYAIWNKITFRNRTISFPIYGLSLSLLYFICEVFGLTLLIRQIQKINNLTNSATIDVAAYITNIGLLIIALTAMALGIKALIRILITPTKGEIKEALEQVKDRELVIFRTKQPEQI